MIIVLAKLAFILYLFLSGSNKHPVKIPINKDEDPTVEQLAQIAENLTHVPVNSQRLIYKGNQCHTFNGIHILINLHIIQSLTY